MRSAASRRSDDRATPARIRDAAIALFGRDGVDRTSVRAIATAAGVSPALVIHHFGSKDRLRDACDRYVIDELFDRKADTDVAQLGEQLQRWLADIDEYRPRIDYLSRMLTDGSPAADRLFDELLASTRDMLDAHTDAGTMRRSDDPEARAALVALSGLSSLLMAKQLGRVFGADYFGDAMVRRMTIPTLELYTHGLYTDDRFLVAARSALASTDPAGHDRPAPSEGETA
ncbi:MAG: TetR family transcriptional regulator [Leifsonia sp.]|nr:TetR family transcriptional regulator [Leifsonia sp.]|tara:strand:+ start:12824 stop:13513 length:690 start_codon:yes stop_codon:yes gene_type:complete